METYLPTITDMVSLPQLEMVKISPEGSKIAFLVQETDWNENCYHRVCFIHDLNVGRTYQYTRYGDVLQMAWIDEETIALLRKVPGHHPDAQIWLYEGLVGEGWPVTEHEGGIDKMEPFAGGFLFLGSDPDRQKKESRTEKFGKIQYFEQEESAAALYYTRTEAMRSYRAAQKTLTGEAAKKQVKPVIEISKLLDDPVNIANFVPSPTGDAVYLQCWPRDDLVYFLETSSYQIKLDPDAALDRFLADKAKEQETKDSKPAVMDAASGVDPDKKEDLAYLGQLKKLAVPEGAAVIAVSPDGKTLLLNCKERDNQFYTQADLWMLSVDEAFISDSAQKLPMMGKLTASLDREPILGVWKESGVHFGIIDYSRFQIVKAENGEKLRIVALGNVFVDGASAEFDVSDTGRIAFIGASPTSFPEIYAAEEDKNLPDGWRIQKLTDFNAQLASWKLGKVESVRWTAKDGTEIEGVLRKPDDFDPSRKYPLVFVVHGGPQWFSPEQLLTGSGGRSYPVVQFVNQGYLVLQPNYRGSLGRGQAFAELNKDNLGVGDLWDLEGAIDALVEKGWVDPDAIGCMGWSQGGYISAFAGLHSDRFKAVSVGAGISDWYTYHISNDIPQFTTHYLSKSPFEDRSLYQRTSPMSNLEHARTPTLIQHGENDQRVPLSNAKELYRGLRAKNMPVELFIYPGMGHSITKPRENRAVMHQNFTWFSHYLSGTPLDFFEMGHLKTVD